MQPVPDSVLAPARDRPVPSDLSDSLLLTPDARAFICLHRPELAPDFEIIGDQARIPIASLLKPAPGQFVPSSGPSPRRLAAAKRFGGAGSGFGRAGGFRVPGWLNSELGTRNSEPNPGLGDRVAAVLHRLRIDRVVGWLMRRGILRGCGCQARREWLNEWWRRVWD